MKFYENLLATIAEAGVEHIFGVPGDALNPLTEALRKQRDIRWVRTAHEEGAAFAASGAAKLTGRLQVCAGTVGPGALHLINGLADADKDGAPVLAILGQIPRRFRGSDYHQEIDLRRVLAPIVGHVAEIEDERAAPHAFVEAINFAIANRAVSALIVSAEVGEQTLSDDAVLRPVTREGLGHLYPSPTALAEVVETIRSTRDITIFAGDGCRGAEGDVLTLAERLRAPLIRTLKARDLFPDDHELVCGELGVVGSRRAVEAMRHCRLLLMIGTDFPYRDWYNDSCTAIQIEQRASVIGRRSPRTIPLHADAGIAVCCLLDSIQPRNREPRDGLRSRVWEHAMEHQEESHSGSDRLQPQAVIAALAEAAPDDAVFTCDTGTSTVWTARHLHTRPGQRITFCANLGSMAYALPAGVGSALVAPERTVVAITGDGAFNMLMGELLTAVEVQANLKVVVLDNSEVGLIKFEQEAEGFPESSTGQKNPDYAALAASCGAFGVNVAGPADLAPAFAEAFSRKGPAVVGVRVDPDALVFPPKVTLGQAWSFGLARAKELFSGSER